MTRLTRIQVAIVAVGLVVVGVVAAAQWVWENWPQSYDCELAQEYMDRVPLLFERDEKACQ